MVKLKTLIDKITNLDKGDKQYLYNYLKKYKQLEENIPIQISNAINKLLDGAPEALDTLKEIDDALNDLENCKSVTYTELVELRNNSQLIPGKQYRITDYITTTIQEDTSSAGHQFDIIVTADTENTLNENAKACLHEGDTYFSNAKANLSAWEIKYCLDNDELRFAWIVDKYIVTPHGSVHSGDYGKLIRCPEFDGRGVEEYQFAWGVQEDIDDKDPTNFVYTKTHIVNIGDYCFIASIQTTEQVYFVQNCKGVIYYMKDEWDNECPYDFKNILFKRNVDLNGTPPTIDSDGEEVYCYTFTGFSYNVNEQVYSELKDGSLEPFYNHYSDEGGYTFCSNVIKPYIKIDNDNWKVSKQKLNNIVLLGYWEEVNSNDSSYYYYYPYCCAYNKFEENCYDNTLEYGCYYNNFKELCHDNILKSNCTRNNFGIKCDNNIMGDGCQQNELKDDNNNIIFKNSCINNIIKFNCGKIYFEDGVEFCEIYGGSSNIKINSYVKNTKLDSIISGNSNSLLTIAFQANKTYTQHCAYNSQGVLKVWCDADLV